MLRRISDMPLGTIGFEAVDTGFRARHAISFDRLAVVSDEDWMRAALSALSFLLPGKAKGFRVRDLPSAKAWLAEELET